MPPNHADDGLLAAHKIRAAVPSTAVLVLSQFLFALACLVQRLKRGVIDHSRHHAPDAGSLSGRGGLRRRDQWSTRGRRERSR